MTPEALTFYLVVGVLCQLLLRFASGDERVRARLRDPRVFVLASLLWPVFAGNWLHHLWWSLTRQFVHWRLKRSLHKLSRDVGGEYGQRIRKVADEAFRKKEEV